MQSDLRHERMCAVESRGEVRDESQLHVAESRDVGRGQSLGSSLQWATCTHSPKLQDHFCTDIVYRPTVLSQWLRRPSRRVWHAMLGACGNFERAATRDRSSSHLKGRPMELPKNLPPSECEHHGSRLSGSSKKRVPFPRSPGVSRKHPKTETPLPRR